MRKKNSNTFELIILGTSSATPSKNRHPSAHLLNIQEQLFLIDCGEASQVRLFLNKIHWNQLSHIFISHLHGDHIFGLPGLLSSMGLNGRQTKLQIVGPEGLQEYVETSLRLSYCQIEFELEFIVINHTQSTNLYNDGELSITSFPLDHRVPCVGYCFKLAMQHQKLNKEKLQNYNLNFSDIKKLQIGENVLLNSGQTLYSKDILYTLPIRKSFAYCSDTRYNESILPYIEDVDLLYHETTYAKDLKQKAFDMGHATTIEAAQMAKLAKVRQLVIGHYSSRYHELQPLLEECQEVFEHTILGVENLRIRI